MTARIFGNWRTTVQPILTVFLVVSPLLLTPDSPIHSHTVAWLLGVLSAAAKVVVGMTQIDPQPAAAGSLKPGDTVLVPNGDEPGK